MLGEIEHIVVQAMFLKWFVNSSLKTKNKKVNLQPDIHVYRTYRMSVARPESRGGSWQSGHETQLLHVYTDFTSQNIFGALTRKKLNQIWTSFWSQNQKKTWNGPDARDFDLQTGKLSDLKWISGYSLYSPNRRNFVPVKNPGGLHLVSKKN